MTEEKMIWARMAIDRQLLGLNHALLWLETSNESTPLKFLLAALDQNLQDLRAIITPTHHF
jgi:hypothetical protein